jgi:8-oxo-dGTP diphosphatase
MLEERDMILATLCYVKKDGMTLMIHRVKRDNDIHASKWNGLGGKLESGETPEECVVREVREESGLLIKNPLLKGILTFPGFDGENDWYVFVFTAREFEGELIDSEEGHLAWVKDADIMTLPLWEGDRIFLPWLDGEAFFSGRFVYHGGNLVEHGVIFYP